MNVVETTLPGVLLVEPDLFEDHRGLYLPMYDEKLYAPHIPVRFVQDSIITSHKNVLRGIHGDKMSWKLVSCIRGEIYQVVVNCDLSSEDFGKWFAITLTGKKLEQLVIPPNYGNAFLIMSDEAIYNYKQSTCYDPSLHAQQFTYRWDDPFFGIPWPTKNPILSNRDANAKFFERKIKPS